MRAVRNDGAADEVREHVGRDARRDVDDHATGKVEHAVREEPAVVEEDPVRERAVDEDVPQARESEEPEVCVEARGGREISAGTSLAEQRCERSASHTSSCPRRRPR